MHLASILPLVALPLSLAKTITIGVGEGGLVFKPESVTADVGDLLEFHFYPKNHSVVQGIFSSPCQPLAGGVYSGFMPEEAGEGSNIFQAAVNSTDTLYFYCSQIQHCQHGMAMVVNPPSTGATLAAYQAAALNASTVSPTAIAGGVFLTATSNTTSGNSTTPSATSPTPSVALFEGAAASSRFSQCGMLGLIGVSAMVLAMI